MSSKITASIQARMGSSRLPGKVLANIQGEPMLLKQINRLRRSRLIDEIIVATSTNKKDDQIENFCVENNITFFRGDENDVLGRICEMLQKFQVDVHVELYGDSPLPDISIINEAIGIFLKYKDQSDYFSNAIETTYPPGCEVSIYFARTLLEVNKKINSDDSLREHVGYNITRFPEIFNLYSIKAPSSLNKPNIYLEVDTENDLKLIREIYKSFEKKGKKYFSIQEIIEFLEENPNLIDLNNNEIRRWKALRKN